ncbi:uncharacterized protein LOC121529791 [Drosophila eugracilis]|uniref:uncharacterized protein LOC121529791 n=1 Tax=Drosophila eugracilis TaxID=29029 RepID=UPI001BDAE64F|nr:uncharacterized protein LOC121529791 [Drosophila eugracilis]
MPKSIVYFLLWILTLSFANCRPDFSWLFPGYSYPSRPPARKPSRSYKEICRVVNSNGFTNPGGVPKCPF